MTDIDRWTTTAVAPGIEPEVRLPDLRTASLGKKVRVKPATKALLEDLGARLGIGAGGIAARLIEELASQGMLRQTWRAACNRRRKSLYRLRRESGLDNPCGCGATCEDKGPDCRYLHRTKRSEA